MSTNSNVYLRTHLHPFVTGNALLRHPKIPRKLLIRLSIGGIDFIAWVRCCFQRGGGAVFCRIVAHSDPHIVQCYPRAWHPDVGSGTSIMWVLLCALMQTMRNARAERLSPAGWRSCKQEIDAENRKDTGEAGS
jgi:hypothetical protein